jgi:hypothetical protein
MDNLTAYELIAYIEFLKRRIETIDTERIKYDMFIETCDELGFDAE